jgi:murein DD-endopeptidase MepM/ murein hydrolase activator NlpD
MTPQEYGVFQRSTTTPIGQETKYLTGMKPADATARYGTDEGLTYEQQLALAEAKAKFKEQYGGGEDDVEWKQEINPITGVVEWTAKGTRAGLEQGGLSPPGTNPKAVAQTGGAAAIPAGDPRLFFAKPNSGKGVRTDPIVGGKRMHKGEDFAKPEGTPIPAEQDGKIIQVGGLRGMGPHANIVEYADGSRVIYGHNASSLPVGTVVKRGQAIGTVGSKGRSTGPHVHRQIARSPQPTAKPTDVSGTRTDRLKVVMTRVGKAGGDAKIVGNQVHVTNPNTGTVFVFDENGKRVQ